MSNSKECFCSVIMPVHNGEKYLAEAINSVLIQDHNFFEFLIIENGSDDSSLKIIQSFKDPRIKIIFEKKTSQIVAYNRGFREARGEYVFIADQDDISAPTRFSKQLSLMMESNADICGSFYNIIDNKGKVIGKQELPVIDATIKDELLYKNYTIFNSSACIRKHVFEKCGYYDENFFPSADYEFYLRASKTSVLANFPDYLYSWRIHKNQISSKHSMATREMTINISLKYLRDRSSNIPKNDLLFRESLVFYNNNKLLIAFSLILKALFNGFCSRKLLRYLFALVLGGFLLKILRSYSLSYTNSFKRIKVIWYFLWGERNQK
ncbi:MAG: glycosyltransferase [Ignavibacteria bacterium]|nr:glycosyltransferase [Ignavibacteria bacterium]